MVMNRENIFLFGRKSYSKKIMVLIFLFLTSPSLMEKVNLDTQMERIN